MLLLYRDLKVNPVIGKALRLLFPRQISTRSPRGDYRFYLFVEFFPAIVLGMIVALFSPKFTRTYDLAIAFSFFVLAKLFELFDQQTYSFFGIVSGHTLKHLIAGFCILRMLILRRPVCYNSGLN